MKTTICLLLIISYSVVCNASYIVGGFKVEENTKYPFIVKLSNGCAGVIIDKRWVLTAGHCSMGIGHIVAGEIDLSKIQGTKVNPYAQLRNIKSRILHPDYKVMRHERLNANINDFLLLRLSHDLILNNHNVAKISLAQEVDSEQFLVEKEIFKVIGWGATDRSGLGASEDLLELEIPFIPYDVSNGVDSYSGAIQQQTMISAGFMEGQKDACHGDSGGPLFKSVNGNLLLFGIVSGGKGCAEINRPGVYSKVSSAYNWIKTAMNNAFECEVQGAKIELQIVANTAYLYLNDAPEMMFMHTKTVRGNRLFKNPNGRSISISKDNFLELKMGQNQKYLCDLNQYKNTK